MKRKCVKHATGRFAPGSPPSPPPPSACFSVVCISICVIAGPFKLAKIVGLAFLRFLVSKVPSLGATLQPFLGNVRYEHVPDTPDDEWSRKSVEMDEVEKGRSSNLHARGRSPGPVAKDLGFGSTERGETSSRSTSLRPGGMRLGGSGRMSSSGTDKSESPAAVAAAAAAAVAAFAAAPLLPQTTSSTTASPDQTKAKVKSGLDEWKDGATDEGWGDEFE